MRKFRDPPSALDYVIDFLISKDRGYIVNVIGPAERFTKRGTTIQVVDQNRVYGDGERGLTLHLPYDPDSPTHEIYALFKVFAHRDEFDDVSHDGIPCYAMKFGTNLPAALHMISLVLNKVYEYPELTAFICEVYEEDD